MNSAPNNDNGEPGRAVAWAGPVVASRACEVKFSHPSALSLLPPVC